MMSMIAGWALILAAFGYGVKFWLSSKHLGVWPSACTGMRSLWFLMVVGCMARGVQLVRGSDSVHPLGVILIFMICAVSLAEALAVIKAGRFPTMRVFQHGH